MRTTLVSALPYCWAASTASTSTSTPSIGRVAKGTHQQGNVVVLAVSHREGDGDFGEERRPLGAGRDIAAVGSLLGEVAAGVEDQPVGTRRDDLGPQAGDPAAGVGAGCGDLVGS